MRRDLRHHDRVPVQLTLAEACDVLRPEISEKQLRRIIQALRWQPAGTRPNGHPGRPQAVYDYDQITKLHAALTPWLELRVR